MSCHLSFKFIHVKYVEFLNAHNEIVSDQVLNMVAFILSLSQCCPDLRIAKLEQQKMLARIVEVARHVQVRN
jgi:hypothetical protein